MLYIAFRNPSIWDELPDVYSILNTDAMLVESESLDQACKAYLQWEFSSLVSKYDLNWILTDIFQGFCWLEGENDDVLNRFGEKDGSALLAVQEKYGWENLYDGKVDLYDDLTEEDRNVIKGLSVDTLYTLYEVPSRSYIVVMPVSQTITVQGAYAKLRELDNFVRIF